MPRVNGFCAEQHLGAVIGGHHPDAVVELDARHRAADRRERRTGPLDFDVASEPDQPQPAVLHAPFEPRPEAEPLQLQHRARGQAVAARFVAGKLRRVDDEHVATGATGPGRSRRARRPGSDDHHVGACIHASQYVGRVRTPASVVAGVDFGDPNFAQEVRDGVARIEDLMATELGKADELMSEAVQHLFQAGGKRFRPLFTVLSARLGPEPDAWQVTVAGAVIELVHLATLYHDDVCLLYTSPSPRD